jgi:L-threonylcarbamoyladenylate synthase
MHDLGLVAFPTETVYGLGAQIRNKKQCEMVFQIKERPFTDPLIVHVNNIEQAVDLIDKQNFQE